MKLTKEQIEEGNMLIAKFMESKSYGNLDKEKYLSVSNIPGVSYFNKNCNDARFHKSWDWLMPVYQKINNYIQIKSSEDFVFGTETDDLQINIWNALEDENACIDFLFPEIIKFIKYYNTKNPNK